MTTAEQRKIFSKNLNYYISLTGKTQKEIAKDIGVNYTTLNMWALGKSMPTMGKVQQIADYFNIRNIDLINERSEETISDQKQMLINMVASLDEDQAAALLVLMKTILHK